MIDLRKIEGIYLYIGKTDMRMSINGLSVLAQELVSIDDMRYKLFIFCGRSKKNIKILELDYDGWWLYQKKLFSGKFKWPKANEEGKIIIDKRQLQWLLDGLDVIQKGAHKEEKIKITY